MILHNDFLEDLKEHIRGIPDAALADRGLSKEQILADGPELERLWALYQKDVEDYGRYPLTAALCALEEVYQISYEPEFESYGLLIRKGERGDYYNAFESLAELREAVSREFTQKEISDGIVDRLTTFPISQADGDGCVTIHWRNFMVWAQLA